MLNCEQLIPNLNSTAFTIASELHFHMFKAVSWAHFSAQANRLLKVLSFLSSISLEIHVFGMEYWDEHIKRGEHFCLRVSTSPSKEKGLMGQLSVNDSPGEKGDVGFGFTTEISSVTRDQAKYSQPYLFIGSKR